MFFLKVYAIHDEKALAFLAPFVAVSDGLAMRSFLDVVKDPQSVIFRYPSDFRLYCIGDFDERTGRVHSFEPGQSTPRLVASAADFHKSLGVFPVSQPPAENSAQVFSAAETKEVS